ncbi:hypothetical protein OIU77_000036 [Salix suchowensis]|uniref:Uncharacterized protein n=1 Tax=Salix suchowensis TaxID=1278906 RepID=A0ABQ9B7Z1_9ROSI|nr:hypothetical protein OIU77_000036 [Salix suchowensis]
MASRAENLVDRLKLMADNRHVRGPKNLKKPPSQRQTSSIHELQQNTTEFSSAIKEKAIGSVQELKQHAAEFSSAVKDSTKRVTEDCREGVEKLTQKFKS